MWCIRVIQGAITEGTKNRACPGMDASSDITDIDLRVVDYGGGRELGGRVGSS